MHAVCFVSRNAPSTRCGVQQPVHSQRTQPYRYPLIIGGIDVPHTRGCVAHSDGDVLLHCITDALLGALSLPDIGQLFPDSDPKWKVSAQ